MSAQYVVNAHGNLLLRKDFIKYFWDYAYEDIDTLDFTFLNMFNTFIFVEIEEYSFFIIEILLKKFPNKKIFSFDPLSSSLWKKEQVGLIKASDISSFADTCLVYSSFHEGFYMGYNNYNMRQCSSYHIMYTLYWMRKKECFGDKNSNKTIFLIDFATNTNGLIDLVRIVSGLILYARRRNWIPVVHLDKFPNQYLNSSNDDMWEYFFEPPSRISYEEAMHSKNVYRTETNDFIIYDFFVNPLLVQFDGEVQHNFYNFDLPLVKGILRINYESLKHIHSILPKKFSGKDALGVVCRGSDYSKSANKKIGRPVENAGVTTMIRASEDIANRLNCKYIFLATEDEVCFKEFQKHFGKRLLFINQKRVSYDYENNEYRSVASLLNVKDGKTFGRTYLAAIYGLSQCKGLISSMGCGAFVGAMMFCDTSFEYVSVIREE